MQIKILFFLMVEIYIKRVVSITRPDGKCYNVCLINVSNLGERDESPLINVFKSVPYTVKERK